MVRLTYLSGGRFPWASRPFPETFDNVFSFVQRTQRVKAASGIIEKTQQGAVIFRRGPGQPTCQQAQVLCPGRTSAAKSRRSDSEGDATSGQATSGRAANSVCTRPIQLRPGQARRISVLSGTKRLENNVHQDVASQLNGHRSLANRHRMSPLSPERQVNPKKQ